MSKKPSKASNQLSTVDSNTLAANNSTTTLSTKIEDAKKVIAETDTKIAEGLAKPTASTGIPIAHLSGGSKFMAQLSNIGGGSLATGGGGIRDGFNTIMANASAKGFVNNTTASDIKSIECDSTTPFLEEDNTSE